MVPRFTVGSLDGSQPEVFGLITDIEADPEGRIVIADERMLQVRLFDASGRFVASAGRAGQGPGEYRAIEAMMLSPDGELAVLDPGNRRIIRYGLSDSAVSYVDEAPLPLVAHDICGLGRRTFVSSVHDGRVLHQVARDGSLVQSFGGLVQAEGLPPLWAASFTETLNVGRVVCSEEQGLIVFVPRNRPEVRAFGVDGTPRWRAVLPEWSQMGMEVLSRSRPTVRMTLDPKTNGTSHSVSAVAVPPHHLLVQVIFDKLEYSEDEAPITTFVLSLRDGTLVSRAGSLPRIAAVRAPLVYTYSNNPWPTFMVLQMDSLKLLQGR